MLEIASQQHLLIMDFDAPDLDLYYDTYLFLLFTR